MATELKPSRLPETELKQYRLRSNDLLYMPGLLVWWKNLFLSDPHRAFWITALAYNTLPAALIHDLLDGTLPYTVDDEGTVAFAWGEPMKDVAAYMPKSDQPEDE